jgi:hypothetical protein
LKDGKDNRLGCNEHESPGEQLARLIKEAGQKAREQRAKVLEKHFQMVKAAVEEGASRRKQHVRCDREDNQAVFSDATSSFNLKGCKNDT